MEITVPAKPEPIGLDTEKAALIVVDMQNSFCKPGGMMDYFGKLNAPVLERVIAVNKKLIEAFRVKRIKVIYLRMTYGKEVGPDSPFYWKEGGLVAVRENPELKGKFLTKGTRDWAIIDELTPKSRDIIINKSRFSGFVNTRLDARLKELKIKYLFFAGVFTNVCVESTARDAAFHEYFPILVKDACGQMGPGYIQDATEYNIAAVFGWVTASGDVIKSLG